MIQDAKPIQPGMPTFNGITVIPNSVLPHRTMVVSLDIYKMLREHGEANAAFPVAKPEAAKP
ncbi:hypothetical protein VV867_09055 [Pseudomonas sp. JH-2]|uniref:hypothetical protein n=1 Tax=Pseudomonas sp. JH-2 TaxID=3114998 RepID=UPI002E261FFA|nr:hypothetical protein [Pseudomonas sp. JH-2]